MLAIRPFKYGLAVTSVYDNGSVYPAAVLDLTDEDILKKFSQGVSYVTAVSLQIGYPTLVSVPHSVINGFRSLVAVSLVTDYSFPAADKIKAILSDPAALAAAAAAAAGPAKTAAPAKADAAPKKEEKKEEKEEEEADADMGGLFGGGDDDGY